MTDESNISRSKNRRTLKHGIAAKAERKLEARRNPKSGLWFGLGMMGLVGWSIVIPTLLGASLGNWLDQHHTKSYSWTLMLLIIGLVIGCWNAWHWVSQEDRSIHEEQENKDE